MNFYHTNAQEYCNRTFSIDLTHLYKRVLPYVRPSGKVLDIGCGSGRDSLYFHNNGFDVTGLDVSLPMIECAKKLTDDKFPIKHKHILDCYDLPQLEYNLIWCCASMILIDKDFHKAVLGWFIDSLAVGGVLYASFKRGENTRIVDGMIHTHLTDDFVKDAFKSFLNASIIEYWITEASGTEWINVLVRRDCVNLPLPLRLKTR